MVSPTLKALAEAQVPESYWRSLRYFNIYRLLIAALFMLAIGAYGAAAMFGASDPHRFARITAIYLLLALACFIAPAGLRSRFNLQLTVGVMVDILSLTLLIHASGGARSGVSYLLLVVLAAAGLVGQGRLTLFYAAIASVAVLIEQGVRVLAGLGESAEFFHVGMTSLGFFGVSITARLLARRVVANEELARQRGKELNDQLRINQSVIRDMEDGVLVVDELGVVRQMNPQAGILLAHVASVPVPLDELSVVLAERFPLWRNWGRDLSEFFPVAASDSILRARFVPPDAGGNSLIYIADIARIQAHAQQIKLAALGRLAANMAHEIRNPLAAISHAAELMGEEHRDATHERLTRIIGENAQRLNRLVNEVLELGRRDRAMPEMIRLTDMLDGLIDEMSLNDTELRQIIQVKLEVDVNLRFDRGHLFRVLSNLLHNAVRYCRREPSSVRVEVRVPHAGQVEVHVIDDGPGIDEALRIQVFEPFFTTHTNGTGLGLYIARELCEANSAMLALLENAPGAHFRILGTGEE